MITLTGFYRDADQAHVLSNISSLPLIKEQPRSTDKEKLALAAKYLSSGYKLMGVVGWGTDAFDQSNQTNIDVLTDGEWVWPADAAYYSEKYGILPPAKQFVDKIIFSQGVCPELTSEQADVVRAEVRSGLSVSGSNSSDGLLPHPPQSANQALDVALAEASELARAATLLQDEAIAIDATPQFVDHLKAHGAKLAKLRDLIHDARLTKEDLDNGAIPRQER